MKMQLQLIRQGDVSILHGGVPVVELCATTTDITAGQSIEYSLPKVVNFLRSGCPMVQLSTVGAEELCNLEVAAFHYQEALANLSIPGESFYCIARESSEKVNWLGDKRLGRCIEVTRGFNKPKE